jgi:hypothetical protein
MIYELVNRYGHVAGVCPSRREAEVLREVLTEKAQSACRHMNTTPWDCDRLTIRPRLIIE